MKLKPTSKELKKVFNQIVAWAQEQGCQINCYWDKKTVNDSNGYFSAEPKPSISMGLKGRPLKKSLVLLLHEFCHYWQWKTGFLGRKDDQGNLIYGKILDGIEVTPEEREIARKFVSYSEYDCEKRTVFLIKRWNLQDIVSIKDHIRSANTYNRHIAWSIGDKRVPGSCIFFADFDACAKDLKVSDKWISDKQIIAPISTEHQQVFQKAHAKKKRS